MNLDTQEYKTIFADAGWEHVTQFLGDWSIGIFNLWDVQDMENY